REDWMRRLGPLYGGAVALIHSTPWRWPETVSVGNEARSPFWVVAIGFPIGLVAYVVAALLDAVGLPATICAFAGLATLTLASAAIVEKGLVARIDGSESTSPSVPAIVGLVFAILIRAAAIAAVSPDHWLGLFIAAALAGRWAAIFLQALGDPIIDDDTRRSLVATPAPAWLTAAISIGVATLVIIALGKRGIVALALTAAIAFGLGLDAQRRDRGLSSAVVATAAAIGELAILLVAALR
ncbi:MAG TPA: hypothetical protein VMZ53_20050, partial [Kofleriaceae bacterium]|nr:hypothetical protein [Kofleriaceae bacterium]